MCHQKNISVWAVAKDYEYFSTPDEFTYYGCADCGTIFIHPVPVDQLKKIYPANYYSFSIFSTGNPFKKLKI